MAGFSVMGISLVGFSLAGISFREIFSSGIFTRGDFLFLKGGIFSVGFSHGTQENNNEIASEKLSRLSSIVHLCGLLRLGMFLRTKSSEKNEIFSNCTYKLCPNWRETERATAGGCTIVARQYWRYLRYLANKLNDDKKFQLEHQL